MSSMTLRNDRVHVLREAIAKIASIMTENEKIRVTQQGVTAYVTTDPKTGEPTHVNLPYLPDNADDELCNAVQGFLDHQVSRILFWDFKVHNDREAMGGASQVMKMLDDTRAEREMRKLYKGSGDNLRHLHDFYLENVIEEQVKEAKRTGNFQKGLAALTQAYIRGVAGQEVFEEYMEDKRGDLGKIADIIDELAPDIRAIKTSEEAATVARKIKEQMQQDPDDSEGEGDGEGDGDGGGDSLFDNDKPKKSSGGGGKSSAGGDPGDGDPDGDSEPDEGEGEGEPDSDEDEGEGEDGSDSSDDEGEEEEKSKPEDDEGEGEDEKEEKPKPKPEPKPEEEDGGKGEEEKPAPKPPKEEKPKESKGKHKPKQSKKETDTQDSKPIWDEIDKDSANDFDTAMQDKIKDKTMKAANNSEYVIFTNEFDVVEKLPVGSGFEPEMVTELESKVDHMVGPLQKDLERAISQKSLAMYTGGHRSGRLNGAGLTRLKFGDDRVFKRKMINETKDVAVELVVDISGSMHGHKVHTATQAAYALSSVLDRINIKNEVICFTTGSSSPLKTAIDRERSRGGIKMKYSRLEPLYMPIVKGFDERLATETKKRFGWLPNSSVFANNVDGESIMVAANRLLSRKEKGKIMIVLSDGYPAAYSTGGGDLNTHLKATVKKLERGGIKVVGIGINSTSVKEFYSRCAVIQNIDELPGVVMKELRALLIG